MTNELKTRKTDMFLIPYSKLVIKHADNGRFAPHSDEEVKRLAEDIQASSQKQPVGVKKIPGTDTYRLVFGFGRATAIAKINEFLDESDQIPVKAIVVNESDKDMFFSNISENYFHKATNDMDHAHNIRRAIQDFGATQVELAEKYGQSQSWVSQRLILNNLNHDIQMKLYNGMITFSEALEIAKTMTQEEQSKVSVELNAVETVVKAEMEKQIAAAPNPSKARATAAKKTGKIIRKAARTVVASAKAQAVSAKPAKGKKNAVPASKQPVTGGRSSSDMKEFLNAHMDPTKYSQKVRSICGTLLNGWEGKMREDGEFSRMFVDAVDAYVAKPQAQSAS